MIRSAASKKMWVEKRTGTFSFFGLALLVAASIGVLLAPTPARAATFTVNSTGDEGDMSYTDRECAIEFFRPGEEPICTLRAAIQQANANSQSDTIIFDSFFNTITLSGEQLQITDDITATKDLVIQGPGARKLTVSGGNASRVFTISGANATIEGLTITNGSNPCGGNSCGFGGGIYNAGTLTLSNSTVSSNTANHGGGIYNDGTMTLTNSTVSGNTASRLGGGMNTGIGGDSMEITNSTVSGNTATNGGGIYNDGTLTLENTTVSGNTASTASGSGIAGGISFASGTANLINTIVAGNSAPTNPDASGTFTSEGNNLFGNTTGSSGWGNSDLKNQNPLLGPLQDNGGPTDTRALLPRSPAVDAGTNTPCPFTDQRGVTRRDGNGDGSVICDIGAFERNDLTPPRVTSTSPTSGRTGVARNANLSATFSETMDRTTLTSSTFKLYRVNSNGTLTQVTSVKVGSTTDGLRAILNPFGTSTTLLAANSRYRAVVTTGAKDRAGNRLDQDRNQPNSQAMVWFFTTGSS